MTATECRIDNAPLREAFLRAEAAGTITAMEVARRVDWWAHSQSRGLKGDGSRVRRALGLLDDVSRSSGREYKSRRATIDVDKAILLAEAIPGIESWEIGA